VHLVGFIKKIFTYKSCENKSPAPPTANVRGIRNRILYNIRSLLQSIVK
jgi:hypothetical protein